jgi:SAM-dependent methyltransferase
VSVELLRRAGMGQGHRVLDVATGIGEPALTAAGIVGAEGEIVGTDLSPRMIDIARQRAANQVSLTRRSTCPTPISDRCQVPPRAASTTRGLPMGASGVISVW